MLIKNDKVAVGGTAQDEIACPKGKTAERPDRTFLKKYKLGNHDQCLGRRVDVFAEPAQKPVWPLCFRVRPTSLHLATPFEQTRHLDMAHQRSPAAKQRRQFCFNHLGRTQLAACIQDK
jgi:hypothetical protein